MQFTVIGVWHGDKPATAGVVAGPHEVYGGDEDTFTDGLWFVHVTADTVADAERLAILDVVENQI
jgi:hypothetical protein